ncbi:hypothetical protein QBC41DRAFT_74218 [Cercophora samala]|uniref:Uncharacterized protein n=1 Tax=Cercophora samala TaxID=330535 RepID=A0AA40DDY5_9PEZI|nr:hypothetical protein QBC41DRAFT_74218 [Cercophora samala]
MPAQSSELRDGGVDSVGSYRQLSTHAGWLEHSCLAACDWPQGRVAAPLPLLAGSILVAQTEGSRVLFVSRTSCRQPITWRHGPATRLIQSRVVLFQLSTALHFCKCVCVCVCVCLCLSVCLSVCLSHPIPPPRAASNLTFLPASLFLPHPPPRRPLLSLLPTLSPSIVLHCRPFEHCRSIGTFLPPPSTLLPCLPTVPHLRQHSKGDTRTHTHTHTHTHAHTSDRRVFWVSGSCAWALPA